MDDGGTRADTTGGVVDPIAIAVTVVGLGTLVVGLVIASGAAPADFDTDRDGDGLSDDRERALGTDPLDPDTDGDSLLDGAEVAGQTQDGVSLPDSDPLHKDIFVQVQSGELVSPLSAAERQRIRELFSQMSVENPDGASGIDLHLVDPPSGRRISDPVVVGENNATHSSLVGRYYTSELLGERRCVYHQVVLGAVEAVDTVGYGGAPGYLSVVEGRRLLSSGDGSDRPEYVTHELLHNVVGTLPDGGYHTDSGWLAQGTSGATSEQSLADQTRTTLNGDGFATPTSTSGC